jgi:hypothetical protein
MNANESTPIFSMANHMVHRTVHRKPRLLNDLRSEIMKHPNYTGLAANLRFPFESISAMRPGHKNEKECTKWCLEIWSHLYNGTHLPVY